MDVRAGTPAQSDAPESAAARILTGVIRGEEGTPLPGARVALVLGGVAREPVRSDRDGRFSLAVPESGEFAVRVSGPGFLPQEWSAGTLPRADPWAVTLVRAAAIAGHVADAGARPVTGAVVRLRHLDARGDSVLELWAVTDDRGEFRFGSLGAGRYVLHTEALQGSHAFATERRGPVLSADIGVELHSGQDARVSLLHSAPAVTMPYATTGGVVTGTLIDAHGDPVDGIAVSLWQARFTGGRLMLEPVARMGDRVYRTDDLGRFRIFHVPAGAYYVVATAGAGADQWSPLLRSFRPASAATGDAGGTATDDGLMARLPVYYPGRTSVADAWPVQILPGQTVNVDMVFSPVAGARVPGTALDAGGRPLLVASGGTVSLVARERPGAAALPPRMATLDDAGRFEFLQVPPGDYVVQATRRTVTSPIELAEFGAAAITVSGSGDVPVVVRTSPTAVISGRIVLTGSAPGRIAPRDVQLEAIPINLDEALPIPTPGPRSPAGARIEEDWTFRMAGLTGRTRLALLQAPPGWWLEGVYVRGVNMADDPVFFGPGEAYPDVTVVLSSAGATLAGRVRDQQARPVAEYRVVAFATDRDRWFSGSRSVKITGPRHDGSFEIVALPPGDYWVAAVDVVDGDASSGEWQEPAFLNRLIGSSRRVTIGEAARQVLDLDLVRTGR